jgi:hypothetical protein
MDRAARLYIIAALSKSGGLDEKSAKGKESTYRRLYRGGSMTYYLPYLEHDYHFVDTRCRQRLITVCNAMDTWYKEHGTLPESLSDLIGTHLDELQVHPLTQAPVEFHVNSPPLPSEGNYWQLRQNTYVFTLGTEYTDDADNIMRNGWSRNMKQSSDAYMNLARSGGTYLRLGNAIFVIDF